MSYEFLPLTSEQNQELLEIINQLRQLNQVSPINFGGLQKIQDKLSLECQVSINIFEEFREILTLQSQYNQAPPSSFEEFPQPYQVSTFYSLEISGGRLNEPHVESFVSSQIHYTAALVNHNGTLLNNNIQDPDDCVGFDTYTNQQDSTKPMKQNKASFM
ncbi:11350_t:CDS:2 [Funneliformis mosseae]|uniref:11350_t:CDS:1 n=1 Tax=Funneliformis mosseae TaxID=27381 RepID=A0A9N9A075_FUNMO|nr:11350_t:CDS:2 [Funneliformis mosseae]